ncbi:SMI1/KNR4 family protein [Pendulispora brunnea]|uniref:SMI1/KNR4 family protein n=1 Tax=Pendulispora brunnea TaxID=2905690 RepID=A0ABZ2K6J3_9BACT
MFESTHGIRLPSDYRSFLSELGNGGAGPYYGVFKLGEMDDHSGFKPWTADGIVGNLAKSFPYTTSWNLSAEELERIQTSEDDEEILRVYWIAIDGAIPICHEGCALRDWLVVSGTEAGRVWHDATADLEGWSPCTFPDGRHMTFADWYLA